MACAHLDSRFFIDHPPSEGFYRKWKSFSSWSKHCFPIYEWDGLLFVAFSDEKPSHMKVAVPVVFLKAEAKAMEAAFEKISPKAAKIPERIQEVPEGLDLQADLPKAAPQQASDNFSIDQLEGIEQEPTRMTNIEELSEEAAPEDSALPEGLDEDSLIAAQVSESGAPSPNSPEEDLLIAADALEPGAPSPKSSSKTSEYEAPSPKPPSPKAPGQSSAGLGSEMPSAQSLWFQKIFEQMEFHFKKSMILLIDGNKAIPWKWSGRFRPQAAEVKPVLLDFPSPFRVAYKTQKPYHGEVVSTDEGDKFFIQWTQGENPDHLTVAPIIEGEQLIGFLVGVGESAANNKNSLSLAERLAFELGVSFKINPELFQAA